MKATGNHAEKLKRLKKFLDNEGLAVGGCGCCDSPWVEVFSDEAGEASTWYDWPGGLVR